MALFPIPNVVAFPGNDLPLHVFEPRYRKLVHDCVEQQRMVGVCHTVKAINTPAKKQTVEEMLASNQATYKPHQIFSAGYCEILETTADGRIIANVSMSRRLQLVEEIQSLPYRIVSCVEVNDTDADPEHSDDNHSQALQQRIHEKLIALIEAQSNAEEKGLAEDLKDPAWTSLTPHDYSFRIFQCIQFDADILQSILETRSAYGRLDILWNLLGNAG